MSQSVTGRLMAMTPLRSTRRPKIASAGGHESQPWLVKSSTTTGRLPPAWAGAARTNKPAAAAARARNARERGDLMDGKIGRAALSLQSLQLERPGPNHSDGAGTYA